LKSTSTVCFLLAARAFSPRNQSPRACEMARLAPKLTARRANTYNVASADQQSILTTQNFLHNALTAFLVATNNLHQISSDNIPGFYELLFWYRFQFLSRRVSSGGNRVRVSSTHVWTLSPFCCFQCLLIHSEKFFEPKNKTQFQTVCL
jgi:hypothetical protein